MIRGKFQAQDNFDLAGHRLLNWKWLNDIPTDGAKEGQVLAFVNDDVVWSTATSDGIVSVEWADLTGVPSEFPPEDHTHPWDQVTDKPTTFPPASHTHEVSEITDFPTTWAWTDLTGVPSLVNTISTSGALSASTSTGDVTLTNTMTWTTLPNKPLVFPPEDHTHVVTDITDFPTTWAWTDLTGVPSLVNSVSGGTNINVSTSTGDVVISAPNAITSLTAGTNISTSGSTISVVDAPTFAGVITGESHLVLTGNLDVGGDIGFSVGGAITGATTVTAQELRSNGDIYVNHNGSDGDSYLYFYDGGNPTGSWLRWDESANEFTVNKRIRALVGTDNIALALQSSDSQCIIQMIDPDGFINLTQDDTSFYIQPNGTAALGAFSSGNVRLYADLQCSGNGHINYGGPDGDSYLYFYDGGSSTGEHLKWDDAADRFEFSNDLNTSGELSASTGNISGNLQVGGDMYDSLRAKPSSDQASTSTSPATTALTFPVQTNTSYRFEALIVVEGGDVLSPNASITFTGPAGSTIYWHEGLQDGGQTPRTTASAIIEIDGTNLLMHRVSGIIANGATLGSLTMTWSQRTASANSVILKSASSIIGTRL